MKVTGRGGAPVPGARARLANPEPRGALRFETSVWQSAPRTSIADEKGALYLAKGVNERSVLTVSAAGYLPLERRSLRGTAAVLALQPGIPRSVLARSADGSPAAKVLVIASDIEAPLGFTDAKGMLAISVPPHGSQRLTLVAEDGRRVNGKVFEQDAPEKAAPGRAGAKAPVNDPPRSLHASRARADARPAHRCADARSHRAGSHGSTETSGAPP